MSTTFRHSKRQPLLVGALLALATLAVYWPVRHFDFINYDDGAYVYENPHVQKGLALPNVRYAFTTLENGNWIPLTWLSYLLDTTLYGTRPAGYHLTNLLLHTASVVFIFLALCRMTNRPGPSALVAAVFALHPLRLESVVWIAERKDVLSTACFTLGLLAYARYAGNPSAKRFALVFVCLLLGLLAKPMLVTFPFVLLLLDVWPLGRAGQNGADLRVRIWPLCREKIPFLILCAMFAGISLWAQHSAGALAERSEPGLLRVLRLADNYGFYVQKTFWPAGLALPYPLAEPSIWRAAGWLLLLTIVTLLALRGTWKRPWVLVGWLWFLGTLVPVIGFIPLGSAWVADRYSYVPSIGLALMVVWAIAQPRPGPRWLQPVTGFAGIAVVAALAATTWLQLPRWKDSLSLFGAAVMTAPSFTAHSNLALRLAQLHRYDEAIAHHRQALSFRPLDPRAHFNLGNTFLAAKRYQEALAEFREALRLDPEYAEAYSNLGYALIELGQPGGAFAPLREALRLKPDLAVAHLNLGRALLASTNVATALVSFKTALRLKPDFPEAHNNLGALLLSQGQTNAALEHFTAALKTQPDYAPAHRQLADALTTRGQYADALPHFEAALRAEPKDGAAEQALADTLEHLGRVKEAILHYERALALVPDWESVMNNLAWLLATHPSSEVRDGARGASLAERACDLTGSTNLWMVSTLAAAYAEAGRFAEAVAAQRKACDLAAAQRQTNLADRFQRRLELYRSHQPYHEP